VTGKRRRSHGEGSIFKYRDGFAAVMDLGWSGGKRQRKWVYGKTEREVLGKLADLRRQQEKGQDLTAAPRTFGEWLDEWLVMKERDGTRPRTVQEYRALVNNHVRPALGKVALDKLSPTMVRRLLAEKTDDGLSAGTVRHIHGVIRNALGDAEREELVHRNVARTVRPPALRRPERRSLTVAEAKRLLGELEGHPMEAFYVTALTVGLRRGELLGLRWSDIDLAAGMLTVRQTVQRVGGRLQFTEPKTDRSRRTVPVPRQAVDVLRRHHPPPGRRPARCGGGLAGLRPGLHDPPRHADRAGQPGPKLVQDPRSRRPRLAPYPRSAPRVRHVPARVRRITQDGHEGARAQPDRADHEHLRTRPARDRADCHRRRQPAPIRLMAVPTAVRAFGRAAGQPAAWSLSCKKVSAPGRIRTCDLQIRSLLLYPLSYGRLGPQAGYPVPR
jgi:integrase